MGSTSSNHHFESLSNHFLVAMPGLHDPNFSHAVIYICEHGPDGAMGLVINNPLDVPISQIFEQFELGYSPHIGTQPLLSGGPVQIERGFVLHRAGERQWESTRTISGEVSLTASRDIISDIAIERGPSELLITLGYAGWGPGQLEEELAHNAWLTVPGDADILFNTPFERRASAAAAKIGIDLNMLSTDAGHA
ncbi:YqgE/AlgH family protein [uncultured Porticoccus sp.]|uniref:YqgE/AlgH family protein n=1 Tax=Porticoccus sp. TaxID=2024853 RepID=UPI000C1137B4|nr:MAG: YqgE/AlgH family protein [Porticoccus sp.]|tara:strand:+ start:1993 stop:2574 length:582 start_codon:yes stop_codon:yes gene_type:complete